MAGEAIFAKNEKLEQARLKRQYITTLVTVAGSATLGSVLISTDLGSAVQPYWEASTGVQPTVTADLGANFTTLNSEAAPSSMGILVACGDARKLVAVRATVVSSATMTAGVATFAGASTSGVTAALSTAVNGGQNVAFSVSCTGLNFNLAATSTFLLEVWYDAQ